MPIEVYNGPAQVHRIDQESEGKNMVQRTKRIENVMISQEFVKNKQNLYKQRKPNL